MFIKLRENSGKVLAVNLSTHVFIRQNAGEFVLVLGADRFTTNIERYPTEERAVQAFENMMDRLKNGDRVCDISEL